MAQAVNAAGAEGGLRLRYDRSSVSHWLSGTRPRYPVPLLIVEVLSHHLGRTCSLDDAGFDERGRAHSPCQVTGQPPLHALAELAGRDADPARREGVRRLPYTVPDPASLSLPRLSGPAGTAGTAGTGGAAGAAVGLPRTSHDASVRFFTGELGRYGGGHTRNTLALYLCDAVLPTLGRRGPGPAPPRPQALLRAARLAFVLARMHADELDHGVSQRYLHLAARLADEADDPVTWSIVIRAHSAQLLALGHRRHALSHAEAATAALPRGASPPARAYVHAQLAVGYAALRDKRNALAALRIAETATEAAEKITLTAGPGSSQTVPDPFDAYTSAALAFQTAETLQRLDDTRSALAALARSAAARSADDRRGLALTHARRATLLLRAGQREEALARWPGLVALSAPLRSAAVRRVVHALGDKLRPGARSAATDF
ncbi:hypothetical protein GCM10009801_16600 [Streptomyces albiaxialis]|uniref:Transcriptional regulator n=1 Tax=Streptomyces albiaxialis TaxID=329523 RepID=A0ABP5HDE2_9ACTN